MLLDSNVYPAITISETDILHMERTGILIGRFYDWLHAHGRLEMTYSPRCRDILCRAATVHDIGKAFVPKEILNKKGRLINADFEVIQQHSNMGAQLLRQCRETNMIAQVVCLYHHERWNGAGYPVGLAGECIPYPARLMAVVDVYDALTHARPYKQAYAKAAALQIIRQGCGTQFDPAICRAFLSFMI